MPSRVLLLMPTTTYKAGDFLEAAARLGVEVVVGSDRRASLESKSSGTTMTLDFDRPELRLDVILKANREKAFDAIVGTDDESTELAALAGESLGLRHNPPRAVKAASDKLESRRCLAAAGLCVPEFRRLPLDGSPDRVAAEISYPCVLKPLKMSASRGVLRADGPGQFVAAFERVAAIVREGSTAGAARALLVEGYVPGIEVALEGLLDDGKLEILALFDKPDKLCGPTFEETIYVTPSRLPQAAQQSIAREASAACQALGLREGPVHAEVRLHEEQPWVLEVAPRTIGGLCSRTLRFGGGISLEELVLRHALGRELPAHVRERRAAGVMMIPIPEAGLLEGVDGVEGARAVAGIEDVQITLHRGSFVRPLPEGNQYLGFLFARAEEPARVEAALRDAHARLRFRIRRKRQ